MSIRRARPDDLEAATELVARANLADLGTRDTSREEMRADWASREAEAWLAERDGRLVGYLRLWQRWPTLVYADVVVDAEARGRGLEQQLVRLGEERARERGVERVHAFAVAGEMASALEREGYAVVRHHLQMAIELSERPPDPVWPEGVSLQAFVPDRDEGAVKAMMDEAFREEYGQQEEPLERWRERLIESDFFDPALWLLPAEGEEIVGAVLAYEYPDGGWIQGLGVRAAHRGRGLGLALLVAAFQAFWDRAVRAVSLSVDVDNPTGATRLYEGAAMRVAFRVDRYEKLLR